SLCGGVGSVRSVAFTVRVPWYGTAEGALTASVVPGRPSTGGVVCGATNRKSAPLFEATLTSPTPLTAWTMMRTSAMSPPSGSIVKLYSRTNVIAVRGVVVPADCRFDLHVPWSGPASEVYVT